MPLELHLLEEVRPRGQKLIARCPACAESGADRRGEHLVIYPDGRYACAAAQGDGEHRRRIHALAGVVNSGKNSYADQAARREWQARRAAEQRRNYEKRRMSELARSRREEIVRRYAWEPAEVMQDSPQDVEDPVIRWDPRHFLATLYAPDAVLWTGEVHHSGPGHARRWRTCAEWQACGDAWEVGPFTSPAVWQPGIHTRSAVHVAAAPYLVLDFDGFDGVKPQTPEEPKAHVRASLAIIRWLRERYHWQLAAILHTGGKSLHAWFHTPPGLEELKAAAPALGMDAGLIAHPEHACRLPGAVHQGTGKRGRVVWGVESPNRRNEKFPNLPVCNSFRRKVTEFEWTFRILNPSATNGWPITLTLPRCLTGGNPECWRKVAVELLSGTGRRSSFYLLLRIQGTTRFRTWNSH